jgi:hypothetical protein
MNKGGPKDKAKKRQEKNEKFGKKNPGAKEALKCWKCGQEGHDRMNCPNLHVS